MENNRPNTTDNPQMSSIDSDATDRAALFWGQYVKEAEKFDEAFLEKNKIRMEGVLVFAGLFSAVTASFLNSMQDNLRPNPNDTTNALLMMVLYSLDNSTLSGRPPDIPTWNGPAYSNVLAQALGYAALSTSLLASLGAVLGKQWLSDYAASKVGSLQERGSGRQQRLDALEEWRFEAFMATLPALIKLAVLLFGVSLSIALWDTNKTVGYVVMSMTGLGVSFYLFATVAPLFYHTCPFRTPLSSIIRDVMLIVAKSVEEIADYWTWSPDTLPQWHLEPVISQVNKMLAHLVLLLPLLILVCILPLVVVVLFCSACVLAIRNGRDPQTRMNIYSGCLHYLRVSKENFHNSARIVRDFARRAQHFVNQDPVPDLDHATPRAVAWLLRASSHPEKLVTALELVSDTTWLESSNLSVRFLHNLFVRSVLEIRTLKDRALPLTKALVVLLCRMPLSVHYYRYIWEETVAELDNIIREQMVDGGPRADVVFTLAIVQKLLRIKLGLGVQESELCPTKDVSQSLLVWLLGLLQTMLRLDHSLASKFFPEASQLYLRLDLKGADLSIEQQAQYCRTFETFFNLAMGFDVEEMAVSSDLLATRTQHDCLEGILAKLKSIKPNRVFDFQEHFITTLTVLSRLATTLNLRDVIKDATIDSWIVAAFKDAASEADENKRGVWVIVGRLVQLAADVDVFNLDRNPASGLVARLFRRWNMGPNPPRMGSKSLLSYLLNEEAPATSKQVVYALRIMLENEDEYSVLASNPHFVDYIVDATEPSKVESIREVGSKVLVATCQSLLQKHDTDSLLALVDKCRLAHFLRRAILVQNPPTMLKDILQANDKDLNNKLLGVLTPALGNPFDVLLAKFHNEPSKIQEHDFRDMEMVMALSDREDEKAKLFKYLDECIAAMPSLSSRCSMALPLAALVGWFLREDGPICLSKESAWKAFLRPSFEKLLLPAWSNPSALSDNSETLQLLLNCTEKWLSTYDYFGAGLSSQSPPDAATLAQVQRAVDQLSSGDYELPADIRGTLHKFSSEIKRQGKNQEGSGLNAVEEKGVTQTI